MTLATELHKKMCTKKQNLMQVNIKPFNLFLHISSLPSWKTIELYSYLKCIQFSGYILHKPIYAKFWIQIVYTNFKEFFLL